MLKSNAFHELLRDYEDKGFDGWVATQSRQYFLPIGNLVQRRLGEIDVVWMVTETFPKPTDNWLSTNFPSPTDCMLGFTEAFGQYHDKWCGREMRGKILKSTSGEVRNRFEEGGWIPFVYIRCIKINAEANVISFDCKTEYELDFNLDEHGICISRKDNLWRFGYACDDTDYFEYWEDTRSRTKR